MLECIELSSVVDFSMGAIDLMAGYMTFGHGPLHVPWAYWQLKLVRESSCSLVQPRGSQSARTQVRARGDILPNGARPQLSKAVVVYGRVGAGIKGVQPPSCVCQPEREECTAQRVHQLCLPGLLETLEQRLSPAPNNCRRCQPGCGQRLGAVVGPASGGQTRSRVGHQCPRLAKGQDFGGAGRGIVVSVRSVGSKATMLIWCVNSVMVTE